MEERIQRKEEKEWQEELAKYKVQAAVGLFLYLVSSSMIFFVL